MDAQSYYDVVIVGGGLAGLSLAIQLARQGHSVALFEKEQYPFHKVCGEYISKESWNFLESLGVPLTQWQVPLITRLQITAPSGNQLQAPLPLGGFGISRFRLDYELALLAKRGGVQIFERTRVEDVLYQNNAFQVQVYLFGKTKQIVQAKACCGAFGKRSNLDVKWKRPFIASTSTRISNYMAVKYHVQTDWPHNLIGLHNFENGYCGISKIEDDHYCLCYLTKAVNLKKSNQSITQMEETVLYKNPVLKRVFLNSKKLAGFPLTISQISFSAKKQVENGVLLLGDAAGMITPLCGNGMSMALHASKIAAQLVHLFLSGNLSRAQLERNFAQQWQQQFSTRLFAGKILQGFFGSEALSNGMVHLFKTLPFLKSVVIRQTHGRPF